LKGCRYSLWKNSENLSDNQQIKLAWIAAADPKLYRAYLFREGLRTIFGMPFAAAVEALDRWISWARRCRIPAFVKLVRSIVKHKARILAAIEHNLSNGLIESTNTKIRLITRIALRVQVPRSPDRPRPTQSRRSQTRPPRPKLIHGSVRRARGTGKFLTRP
jgi:transposase